jgi:hypothetical protein
MGDVYHKGRLRIVMGIVFSVAVVAFALCPWFPLAVVLLAISGAADFVRGTTRTTTMQLVARGPMLGRVMSLDGMSTRGLGQMGGFTAGALASAAGPAAALLFGAATCFVATLGIAWRVPAVRNLVGTGREHFARPGSEEPAPAK